MDVVFSIAHKIAVLHQGRIIATGRAGGGAPQRGGAPRLPRGRQTLTALLEVDGIHTAYGSSRVLFGISLDIKQGECVCLLGRNGVGKTTTMRSIMGLTPPSQGSVRFKGKDITGAVALPPGAARHRLRAGGPAHLRRAHRVGEPRRRGTLGQPRRALDGGHRRASSSPSSASCATAWAACFRAASSRC